LPGSGDPYRVFLDHIVKGKTFENDESTHILFSLISQKIELFLIFKFPDQEKYFYEEIILSTWRTICSKASQCRGQSKKEILAWAKKIAYHIAADLIEDEKKLQCIRLENSPAAIDAQAISDEINASISIYKENEPGPRPIEEKIIYREQMETNLAKLTQQERKVYLLLQYETSKKEIAKHMAISQPRVTQFILQIRKKLLPRS